MAFDIDVGILNRNGVTQQQLIDHGDEMIEKLVEMVAFECTGNLKRLAPKDHGLLANSFQNNQQDRLSWIIQNGRNYAMPVNDGTGIYGPTGRPIHPTTAKCLAFMVGGRTIFTKSIKGQQGSHYIERSISETENRLDDFVRTILSQY